MQAEFSDFSCKRAFFDTKHYPRGFNRSGDFSMKEAQLLSNHGVLLNELTLGKVAPSNPAQERLLKVLQGELPADNLLEKVWVKYLEKTTRPSIRYSCSAPASEGGDYSSSDEAVGDY